MPRKEQMKAPDAPVAERVCHGDIVWAFIRDHDGSVYYSARRGDRGPVYDFPVFDDRTVSRVGPGGGKFWPSTIVDMIAPGDLGIEEFVWAEQPTAKPA